MKRTYIAILAVVMLLSMASLALAVDVATTFNGSYRIRGLAENNRDFNNDMSDHLNYFDQRFRLGVTSTAGEDLKGVIWLELGDIIWGDPRESSLDANGNKEFYTVEKVFPASPGKGSGGDVGADQRIFELKNAYIQYKSPIGFWSIGIQRVALPKGIIIDDDLAAILYVAKPTPEFTLTAGYIKAAEWATAGSYAQSSLYPNSDQDADGYVIKGDYSFSKDLGLGLYCAMVDNNSKNVSYYPLGSTPIGCKSTDVYWLGLTSVGTFGSFSYSADGIYNFGKIKDAQLSTTTVDDIDLKAYAVDLRPQYNIDAGMGLKIGAIFAYASGNKDDEDVTKAKAFVGLSPSYKINHLWSDNNDVWNPYTGYYELNQNAGIGSSVGRGFACYGLSLSAKPTDRLDLCLAWTNMSFAQKYIEHPASGSAIDRGKDIGNEIDLDGSYALTKNLKLSAWAAALMPGKAMKRVSNNEKDDTDTQLAWCLQYDF